MAGVSRGKTCDSADLVSREPVFAKYGWMLGHGLLIDRENSTGNAESLRVEWIQYRRNDKREGDTEHEVPGVLSFRRQTGV